MKIIDLTPLYLKYIIQENRRDLYFKSYPKLFRHYFKYWAQIEYFKPLLSDPQKIKHRIILIKDSLKCIEKKFKSQGFNLNKIKFILLIGQGTTNGHAFNENGNFNVFLPIEAYKTKKQMQIFICHEIAHALHYTSNKQFYFRNLKQKNELARQLITEGLATYFSIKVLKISPLLGLWADYINKAEAKKWLKFCQKNSKALKKYCLKNQYSYEINLFSANDPKNIWKYRAGYLVGLEFIFSIAEKLDLKSILKLNKKHFYTLLTNKLSENILDK